MAAALSQRGTYWPRLSVSGCGTGMVYLTDREDMGLTEEQMKENDEKKWYLRGYERAIREMKRSEERIREMRINRICPSVIADGMPHASGGSDLSGYAARLDEEERKYQKARYLRIKRCKEISDKIERLVDEDEKDVLFFRYIKLMKWEDIAVQLGFSWQHTHKIHARALKNFVM